MRPTGVEWATVAPGTTLVATADGGWVHASVMGGPFSRPMQSEGSLSTTRNLLEAAARAGWASARRVPEPPLTAQRWVYRLCGFYQTTHATPPLMREAARRFAKAGRATLARWAETKAREETGHDTLVLRDLKALGYDAGAAVEALVPPTPAALVRYFERQVRAEDPVGCVGYAYALERLALEVDAGYIASVEAVLPPGVRATRCLRVHSDVGSDRQHVAELVEVVATLSAEERTRIARACYETAALCFEARAQEALTDEALQQRLEPLKLERRQ